MSKSKQSVSKIHIPLDELLGYHLRRASTTVIASLSRRYEELDLKLTQASTLVMIDANPGIKQSDIGRILDIKSANMATLINSLVRKEYVIKKQLDGRSSGLYLSPKGEAITAKIWEHIQENEAWLQSRINSSDKQTVMEQLRNVWR